MNLRKFISTTVFKTLNEGWYHGTPDSNRIEKDGGFFNKSITVDYVKDPTAFKEFQNQLNIFHGKDEDKYFKVLNTADSYKGHYTYNKPLFLSSNFGVAKTYAIPHRAIEYQDSSERVYQVDVDCNKSVTIVATGDRFRFLNTVKVKQGFINAGVSELEIDKLIAMFNYYISDNSGIKTDIVAAIGNWLGFDCIDVVGVLDSYHGGTTKSTVRMVLHPEKARIVRN